MRLLEWKGRELGVGIVGDRDLECADFKEMHGANRSTNAIVHPGACVRTILPSAALAFVLAVVCAGPAGLAQGRAGTAAPSGEAAPSPSDAALVKTYCATCHSDRTRSGELSLEHALEFIAADECVEVTPKNIRLRKVWLDPQDRIRNAKRLSTND